MVGILGSLIWKNKVFVGKVLMNFQVIAFRFHPPVSHIWLNTAHAQEAYSLIQRCPVLKKSIVNSKSIWLFWQCKGDWLEMLLFQLYSTCTSTCVSCSSVCISHSCILLHLCRGIFFSSESISVQLNFPFLSKWITSLDQLPFQQLS